MTHVDLEIDLRTKPVRSKAILTISPNTRAHHRSADLRLDGEHMVLTSIKLNNRALHADEFELLEDALIIKKIPQNKRFFIETTSVLSERTDLFGLYETDGIYLVKAETEGLRRVFYCIDRPDNLASYTTTILADQKKHPVLLSNGELIAKQELPHGTHTVTWSDTLAKPSYLFALVAGNLNYSTTFFTTQSGRTLPIEFYVSSQDLLKCEFAQEVLKKAMAWDETVFNLECDLSRHMVAGVDKYASGASEPTGLNLFNTENLFATPEIKTDLGMLRVLEVVAHEFFHYWSGNRVTIRDWFNLPFKEGLTTFRAALFFEDLFGTELARLLNGKNFDERAPRQSSYIAVRSLYTVAAYEKSADIFRMMMLVIGRELFNKSMGEFLKSNDGRAVTIEETLNALTKATSIEVNSFLPWFTEPGIPDLSVTEHYSKKEMRYTLRFHTQNRKGKPIPVLMGLLDKMGTELVSDTILLINEDQMEFHFDTISTHPIPSLLRSFSAPIHLNQQLNNDNLLVLIQYDSNLYNRCEAAKQLIINLVKSYCTDTKIKFPSHFFDVYRSLIHDETIEPWILAELLSINSEEELIAVFPNPQFELLAEARLFIHKTLATKLTNDWPKIWHRLKLYSPCRKPQFSLFDIKDAGMRRLKEVYYSFQQHLDFEQTKIDLISQFYKYLSSNMTETSSALTLLGSMGCDEEMNQALKAFYEHWQEDTHAINYWFRIQASLHSPSVVAKVQRLLEHPAFDILNPNKIYSLLGTFINNPYGFHNSSGEGYKLIAKMILVLDQLNPPLAANLTQKFATWELYDQQRQQLMCHYLAIINEEATSIDVRNSAKKGIKFQ
jgi:aminopeptidase N